METVAAFDFDGTLTHRDSLLPFLFFTHNKVPAIANIASQIPYLAGFGLKLVSRQKVKESVLTAFYKGIPLGKMKEWGESFAAEPLDRLLRADANQLLREHQEKGHRCVLISASIDIYLHPWAKKMGFHDIITSSLQIDESGNVTGKLEGLNCWGKEKSRRLNELLGSRENYCLYVYGDSRGDHEILAMANYPCYR